jgi:HAD superfamily hydrolase (TIGR01459 family)
VAASPEADYGGVTPVAGVSALARDFDVFILDQWGVLHDGETPYAGAIDCLARLRSEGKHVVILSNSGRTGRFNGELLSKMGFDLRHFDRIVSAGDDARDAIERRTHAFHRKLGTRYFAFTRDGDDGSLLAGLGLRKVERVEEADFIAVIGIESPRVTVADCEPILAAGAARKLPMICANPDVTRPSPQGLLDAPGALARRYEALGGEVFYHGKPYPAIYSACLDALSGCARERIVAVGDSLEHDILGASRVGLRSAFAAGGIHRGELGMAWGSLPGAAVWRRFVERAPARPDYLLPAFAW